jgi:hypothetical protein
MRYAFLSAALIVLFSSARLHAGPPEDSPEWGPQVMHLPVHERQSEQGILRPIPILVELPASIASRTRRVLVHYRLWGAPEWTTIQLRATALLRYEGAIPCLDVSTVTGDFRYFIHVHDQDEHVIARGASRASPYVVVIKNDALLSSPSAPGKCPDPADCPPGLLGCPSEIVDAPCATDRECDDGWVCGREGVCQRWTEKRTRVVVSMQQDFGIVPTTGACTVPSQETQGYACYRGDGAQYAGTPVLTNEPLGFGPGPTRVVVGVDHLLSNTTGIGVRLGWAVLGRGPTPTEGTAFVPVSASARVTRWFSQDPFARLRPFVFVTGGYSMFDIKTSVHVREDPTATPHQPGNDLDQQLTLWKRAGDAFVGGGGGLSLLFAPGTGAFFDRVFVELGAVQVFPFGATVVSPSVGIEVAP